MVVQEKGAGGGWWWLGKLLSFLTDSFFTSIRTLQCRWRTGRSRRRDIHFAPLYHVLTQKGVRDLPAGQEERLRKREKGWVFD